MKKTLIALLVALLLLTNIAGCTAIQGTTVTQEPQAAATEDSAGTEGTDFQQYISGCASKAANKDIKNLEVEYNSIQKERESGMISEQEYTEKMYDFDDTLRKAKVYLPYKSLAAFAYALKTMSPEDRTFIYDNNDQILAANAQPQSEERLQQIYEQGKEIFRKYNLNIDDLISSIQGACYNFALFKVEGDSLELDAERNFMYQTIDDSTKELYIRAGRQIQRLVPAEIWKKVSSFLAFASGRTAAFAQYEDPAQEHFQFGIDVTSMLDQNGNLIKEQEEIIVHETAHIITLNNTQVTLNQSASGYANTCADYLVQYQEDSYLYSFFTRFWTSIYAEYLETTDPFAFYNKNEAQFVSDYAAVAPEEDIAESFRVFIMNDKPTSDSIKDQKVRFFYEYEELTRWREEIRSALSK